MSVELDPGSGGAEIATDLIGGEEFQLVKLVHGALTANAGPVSLANGLPVQPATGSAFPVTDNGGSFTVDAPVGTPAFVRLSDGTSAIATLPVSVASLPLPSGAATATLQSAQSVLLTSIDGKITACNTGAVVIASGSVTVSDGGGSITVDAPVGTPVNVQVGDGTRQATVRDTGSSDSLNVAIVDASGNHVTSFGGGTQYAEDAIHGSGDVGTMALAVRKDTAATTAGTDGDYCPLVSDSAGRLHVNVGNTVTVGSHAVTNAGTFAVQAACTNGGTFAVQVDGGALTSLQLLDDVVLTEDAAHANGDKGVMTLAVRRDANSTLAGSDNDYGPLQLDATGSLKVAIISGAGSGGTAIADQATFTAGSTSFTLSGGWYDSAMSTPVTDGKAAAAYITSFRAIHVNLRDASGAEVSVGGGTQYDEDTASTNAQKLTMAGVVRRDSAATGAGSDGDRTELSVSGSGRLWCSAVVDTALPTGSNVIGAVTQSGTWNVVCTNGGTFAVQATITAGASAIAKAEDVASADADVGVPAMAVRRASPANSSGTDGDYEFLQMSAGRLWVDASGTTLTVASHAVTNAGTFAVQAVCTNGGTFAVQVDGGALTSLQLLDDTVFSDDAAFTPGTSKVLAVGFQADETSTDLVDEGDVGCPRMTLARQVITVEDPKATGEGLEVFSSIDLDETEEDVKTTPGMLYGYYFANRHATDWRYVRTYNLTAANTTVGTSAKVTIWPLPPNSAGHVNFPHPVKFSTALCVAATTGFADSDTGAPGTNDVILDVYYK